MKILSSEKEMRIEKIKKGGSKVEESLGNGEDKEGDD